MYMPLFKKYTSCLRHVFNVFFFFSLYQSCFPLGNLTAPNVTFVWHYLTVYMCDSLFLCSHLMQNPRVHITVLVLPSFPLVFHTQNVSSCTTLSELRTYMH